MIAVVINLHRGTVTGNILEFQINHGYPRAIVWRIFREKEASAQALHRRGPVTRCYRLKNRGTKTAEASQLQEEQTK
jgi:hypothetical protein